MNYLTIETPTTDRSLPNPIVQMFSDAELIALGISLSELLDNHGDADTIGVRTAYTFINLLQQWEKQTL